MNPLTFKIRGGVDVDSKGKAAGKGLLIQENMASTLAVSQDQYVFAESYGVPNPSYGVTTKGNGDAFCSEERHTAVSTGGGQAGQGYPCVIVPKAHGVPLNFRPENTKVYKETATTICNGTNPGHHQGVIVNENPFHPMALDKYNQQATEEVSPTLKTVNGGDDIHCVVVENHHADSRCNIDDSGTVQTLTSWMGSGGNNTPMVMFSKSARARSADDATTWKESQVTNTLNTFDQSEQRTNEIVVTYGMDNEQTRQMTEAAHPVYSTSKSSYHLLAEEDVANTLVATDYKDPPTVTEEPYYIVRRLTPLECCRLQGFPDGWADIDHKYKFSDEDYEFWSSIHSGTREQVRRWYNKLHTDSAEYKMWGNGIALPCALYVFEGIEEEIRLAHESPDVAND